jgi:putative transposase
MPTPRFSESQIVGILREAGSGVLVANLLRRYGVSEASLGKSSGDSVPNLNRFCKLAVENSTLKWKHTEMALENAPIKDLPARKLHSRLRNVWCWRSSSRSTSRAESSQTTLARLAPFRPDESRSRGAARRSSEALQEVRGVRWCSVSATLRVGRAIRNSAPG